MKSSIRELRILTYVYPIEYINPADQLKKPLLKLIGEYSFAFRYAPRSFTVIPNGEGVMLFSLDKLGRRVSSWTDVEPNECRKTFKIVDDPINPKENQFKTFFEWYELEYFRKFINR